MLDFIRKSQLWDALDAGALERVKADKNFNLLTAQSVVASHLLNEVRESRVAEIGGGNGLNILPELAIQNDCVYIDKFDGIYGGPKKEIKKAGAITIKARLGEFDPQLADNSFNIVFSVSVVEHLQPEQLREFFQDCARILKPGGSMLHFLDFFLPDSCSTSQIERFNTYRRLHKIIDNVEPIGEIYEGLPTLSASMVTNPDHVMYSYGRFSKALVPFRQKAQATSLILGLRKTH